ncbi:transglutaminase domain-containing protein [Foetidibacter luteolus]|uniref:transglutaminase domain-containing protein n=1 Tax=Foetidibacter luteolus TaxID=2608880 RepID=UPI00129B041B|nr:transglutaminase domain-containing protein [Foetidibacter luteolus]
MSAAETGKKYKHTQDLLTYTAGLLLIIPLAPFICRFIPPVMLGGINIDLIISFLIAIVLVRLLLWLIKPLVLPAAILITLVLLFNQLNGRYSFSSVYHDYKTLAYINWKVREEKQSDLLNVSPYMFENPAGKVSRLVKAKVQTTDSTVRNFSVQHSLDYFTVYEAKYKMLPRYLSLFRYINMNFKYVPDTRRDEYYATPKETILNGLGGDCDDHSILMASCLMSIGARCRMVIVEGHMYPEMFVGDKEDFEIMQQAIIQLFADTQIHRIYYHEYNGEFWINLDYSAKHPGGPYLNDKVKLVIEP